MHKKRVPKFVLAILCCADLTAKVESERKQRQQRHLFTMKGVLEDVEPDCTLFRVFRV